MKLKDIIHSVSAISPQRGLIAYDFVKHHLNTSNSINISFEGIEDCTSAFCNSFIGKLYMDYEQQILDAKLHLLDIDSSSIWFKKIESAKLLGKDEHIRQVRKTSITDLTD